MPTYEYRCQQCGHQLEAWQKMSDEPLKTCPECKKDTLQKQISATNFQLKGTGWYVTDFRNKDTPKPKETEKPESSSKSTDDKGSSSSSSDTNK